MTGLVSVITPTFNRAELVREAVQSVIKQTYRPMEMIVVDDGSTDGTVELLHSLSMPPGVQLHIFCQENSGAAAARNKGIEAASGRYIQFLDSDDTLNPDKVRLQVHALDQNPRAVAALSYGRQDEGGGERRIGVDYGRDPLAYVEAMCSKAVHVVSTPAPLWKRSFLGESKRWNPELTLGDDFDFNARCLSSAAEVVFVAQELFTVREHGGDRLSDFSRSPARLADLFWTRMSVHNHLVNMNCCTPRCADNTVQSLRTIYVNYLRRMKDIEIDAFERAALAIASSWRAAATLRIMIGLRRLVGRRVLLSMLEAILAGKQRIRASK